MVRVLQEIKLPVSLMLVGALLAGLVLVTPAVALDLGDLIKVFGIGYAVSAFNRPINDFINNLLGQREAGIMGATKVVPILSVGAGTFIGAAQVMGAPDKVPTVQAVAQVEARFEGRFRMRALIPISTKTVRGTPQGVSGTGVSALIDFRV